jgi:hypothetical protein
MEKKAKITRAVFKNEWSGNGNTVYYHDIELDNGDKGSIGSKEKMPAKLNPGNELTYTIDNGKIKAVNAQVGGGGFSGGGGKKGPDPKVQIVGFAMSYTKDLIVAGKIDIKILPEMFEKIHALMAAKV